MNMSLRLFSLFIELVISIHKKNVSCCVKVVKATIRLSMAERENLQFMPMWKYSISLRVHINFLEDEIVLHSMLLSYTEISLHRMFNDVQKLLIPILKLLTGLLENVSSEAVDI